MYNALLLYWWLQSNMFITIFKHIFLNQFIPIVHRLFFSTVCNNEDITWCTFYQWYTLTVTMSIHKRQKTHIINAKGPFHAFLYINYFYNAPTKCTLYLVHTYLPNLSYMFQCVTHHPQGELRILAQNCQLFIRLVVTYDVL